MMILDGRDATQQQKLPVKISPNYNKTFTSLRQWLIHFYVYATYYTQKKTSLVFLFMQLYTWRCDWLSATTQWYEGFLLSINFFSSEKKVTIIYIIQSRGKHIAKKKTSEAAIRSFNNIFLLLHT